MTWVPAPSPIPWLSLSLAIFAVVAIATRGLANRLFCAAVLALLVLVDLCHTVLLGLAAAGTWSNKLGTLLSNSYYSIIFVVAAFIWSIYLVLQRRQHAATFAVLFSGLSVTLVSGIGDFSTIDHSQLVFVGPNWLARAAVAVTLGAGLGISAAAAGVIAKTNSQTAADSQDVALHRGAGTSTQ